MKESDFLKNFAKILNVEDKLQEIEEKKAKEKQMLEQLGLHLGVSIKHQEEDREVPAVLLTKPEADIIEAIAEALPEPVEEPVQELPVVESIVEEVIPPMPKLPEKDIITKSVEKIAKASPADMEKVVDKIPASLRKELDILKKSVADFHRFAQRHSQMGGGGEVRLLRLDDVDASTIGDGLYLRYDAASKMLVFDTPAGGGGGGGDANNASYLGGVAANQYAYANSLTNYQTTSGLSANVATLTANNAGHLGGVAANQYAYANSTVTINQTSIALGSNVSLSSLVNGTDTLSLNGLNKVDLPGGTAFIFSATNNITIAPDNTNSNYLEIINDVGATLSTDRSFEIRTNADGTDRVWSFTQGGSLFFPDSTLQTTAFTGNANNASYLGTVAAASYVQNTDSRTLSGNLTFTGANNRFTQDLRVAGDFYVGSNTRAVRTVVSLNTLTGYYSGLQVARADSEQWFIGADTSDKFVVRRNSTTDDITIDNSNGLVTIGSLTVGNTITGSVSGSSNNASYLGGIAAAQYAYANSLSSYQTTAGLSANVATLTSNNTSFVGTVSAANVVSNTQLQSNLANYQTTAGLSANVATLTSNNSSFLGGVAAASYAQLNTNVAFGSVTSNTPTAFIAGIAANSGVALQMPHEGALRNMSNTSSTMYFDVNNGGSAHGNFNFRSSNNFTSLLHLGVTKATFNPGMEVNSQTPYVGRTSFNVALDTTVTVDNIKYRISDQGGVFPQIASASGSTVDVCYSGIGYVNGTTNPAMAHNSGFILAADGTWLSVYSSHGLDDRGDLITFHITDKGAGKIYRVTFLVTNNSSNVTGYNIVIERII